MRHGLGEIVEFAAVLAHVVKLPRGVVLGDEFVIALTHGAVAFVFPKERAGLRTVPGKHRQQGLAFHALLSENGGRLRIPIFKVFALLTTRVIIIARAEAYEQISTKGTDRFLNFPRALEKCENIAKNF